MGCPCPDLTPDYAARRGQTGVSLVTWQRSPGPLQSCWEVRPAGQQTPGSASRAGSRPCKRTVT